MPATTTPPASSSETAASEAAPRLSTVGVVGAGVMGTGLAQTLAQTGHTVVLVDVDADALTSARDAVRQNLRFRRLLQPNDGAPADEPANVVLDRIQTTLDADALSAAQFVVENATEKWEVKREIYPVLDAVCDADVVFAANTSAISITRLGGLTARPDRVLGIHFMNPVPMKPVAEVIRGYHTSDATIDTAQAVLAAMGKEGIVVDDMPGFVTNRVLMLTINEAIFVLQDGVADAADVDRIFKTCFGHPMGPLETADLIGLDTILLSLDVLYESYNDDKYRPSPLLKKMVDAGLYGRKSGEGFHSYPSV